MSRLEDLADALAECDNDTFGRVQVPEELAQRIVDALRGGKVFPWCGHPVSKMFFGGSTIQCGECGAKWEKEGGDGGWTRVG